MQEVKGVKGKMGGAEEIVRLTPLVGAVNATIAKNGITAWAQQWAGTPEIAVDEAR